MADIELVGLAARHFVGIRRTLSVADLAAFFAEALPAVHTRVSSNRVERASMPMAGWCAMDVQTGSADCLVRRRASCAPRSTCRF